MNFFKQVDLDWMGHAKYFFALSAALLIIGVISWVSKGGLYYGVDFKGGTVVDVRFAGPPPIDKIRTGLNDQGLGGTIVPVSDLTNRNANEVLINLEEKGEGGQALDAGKGAIQDALHKTLGSGEPGKQDFNAASADDVAAVLTRQDPLHLSTAAGNRYAQLAQQLLAYRDKNRSGVVSNLNDLLNAGATPAVISAIGSAFYPGDFAIVNVEIVGPKVGAELRRQAVLVTLYALGGMLVYIAFRFEWVYGVAAVLAVFHDVLITLGLFSIFHFEISLTVIAALLTLVGYSMNDTIVIFDRVRENLRLMRREPFKNIVNRSINQTLSRTILTSGLTFLTVLVLFLMGGQVLRAFSFALVVGIMVGTYSSFGIAAPLVVAWTNWRGQTSPGPVTAATTATGTAAGTRPRRR